MFTCAYGVASGEERRPAGRADARRGDVVSQLHSFLRELVDIRGSSKSEQIGRSQGCDSQEVAKQLVLN